MSILDDARLILTPNGYKEGVAYTLKPTPIGTGNFDVVRNTTATRVNENGLIELVGANVARIDYTNGKASWLVEPQRTNLLLHSQELDDSYWTKTRLNTTGTPPWVNVETAPDGTQTAEKLIANTQNGVHNIQRLITDFNVYRVFSAFVKADEIDEVRVRMQGNTGFANRAAVRFDLNTKQINVAETNAFGTFTQFDYKIDELPNDWFRIQVGAFIPPSESSILVLVDLFSGGVNFAGNNVDGLYVWGLQLAEDFGSYIPTVASTVTRNADVITVTPPVGTTEITEYFENGTTNVTTVIPSTYQLPNGKIKKVIMI